MGFTGVSISSSTWITQGGLVEPYNWPRGCYLCSLFSIQGSFSGLWLRTRPLLNLNSCNNVSSHSVKDQESQSGPHFSLPVTLLSMSHHLTGLFSVLWILYTNILPSSLAPLFHTWIAALQIQGKAAKWCSLYPCPLKNKTKIIPLKICHIW